jgi:hypothetical protein
MLCIIKNEEMIIKEWIEHYIWQGVQHFYIIDNESTDGTKKILDEYNNIISYYYLQGKEQENHYNYVFNKDIKNNCEWLIICDSDEYIYNKIPNESILTYINGIDDTNINSLQINWKMFGSSGFENQPKDIRKSFIYRQKDEATHIKQIIKTDNTHFLHVHYHEFNDYNKITIKPLELSLNHYAIMSKEYFKKIKMTRGDVNTSDEKINNIRDWNYFEKYDHNEIIDDELLNLVKESEKII